MANKEQSITKRLILFSAFLTISVSASFLGMMALDELSDEPLTISEAFSVATIMSLLVWGLTLKLQPEVLEYTRT
jgi:hypothetical protein